VVASRALLLVATSLALSACRERTRAESEQPRVLPTAQGSIGWPASPTDPCRERQAELERSTALSGARAFEAARVEILGRARSMPVVFERRPLPSVIAEADIDTLRRELAESADPADTIFKILKRTRHRVSARRAIFLSEGYLFADAPHLALRLSQVLRLDHLFEERTVVVERGGQRLLARRHQGKYYWDDGLSPGEPKREANLLLLDRVRTEDSPELAPLHVDLGELKRTLHYDRASVQRITGDGWVLGLSTGDVDSTVIVQNERGLGRLECENVAAGEVGRLAEARRANARRTALVQPILDAAHEIVERRLPFDEPRTEEGQQDGHLRIAFRKAYEGYEQTYEFNGDRYFVFDGFGRPIVPQVCIDFITDSVEWGTGGKWADRGQRREHVRGAIDFKSFGLENARSIEQVAEFGADHPEWFDMVFVPEAERIKFVHRSKFFEQIAARPSFYAVGDVVFILGLKDDDRFHYHSFFVDEVDPLTGAPVLLVSNAGPPQVRTWEGEMQNAPLRSVIARLRLRTDLLEAAKRQAALSPGVPLTPSATTQPSALELPAADVAE
jgi:hypothetical protein